MGSQLAHEARARMSSGEQLNCLRRPAKGGDMQIRILTKRTDRDYV